MKPFQAAIIRHIPIPSTPLKRGHKPCPHVSTRTHRVAPPRADDVRQVGAGVEEEVFAPLLVTDVEGVAVVVYPENGHIISQSN